MMTGNTKNIKLWVAALRSGKYRQTRGALRAEAKNKHYNYCCLGVACKVYEKETGIKFDTEWSENNTLPFKVMNFLNINNRDPQLSDGNLKFHASAWNDDKKYNFKRIADLIENTYLKHKKK